MRIFFRILGLLISFATVAPCQSVRFKHYSSDEGFTGAAFKTMVQDSLGYLWISSGSGLYKFDGYNFTRYTSGQTDTLGLLQGTLSYALQVDPTGKVWTAYGNRIAWFNRDKDDLTSYNMSIDVGRPETMWFDNENRVWLGTTEKGLVCFDISKGETTTYLDQDKTSKTYIAVKTIRDIVDEGNSLLLGSSKGLWRFNKEKKIFSRPRCNPVDSSLIFNGNIKKIFLHRDYIWLWIDEELVKVNAGFSVIQRLNFKTIQEKFDFDKRFEDARVVKIAEDTNQKFWIASQGLGLIYYDPETDHLTNYRNDKNDENSLPSNVLNFVMIDRDKNIWATTVNKGIVQLKKQSLIFYNHLKGMSSTGVGMIPLPQSTEIFIGTNGNSVWRTFLKPGNLDGVKFEKLEIKPTIPGFENVVELIVGKKKLWLGTMQAGAAGLTINFKTGEVMSDPILLQHDRTNPNTIADNFVTSFWDDEDGHLWVGTYVGGINIVNPYEHGKAASVSTYMHNANDPHSLIQNGVSEIVSEDDGSLLIATFGGLDRIKSSSPPHDKIQFEHLLPGRYCNEIYKTFDGTLFVATKMGLFQATKNGNDYIFTKVPLPGDPNVTFLEEDRLGRLWAMSFEGLFFYDRKTQFVLVFKTEDGLPSSRSVMAGQGNQTADGIMIFSNGEGVTLFDPLSFQINTTQPRPVITQLKINNMVATSAKSNDSKEFFLPENINTLKQLTLDHTQNILALEFSAMDFTAPEKNIYRYKLEGFDDQWVQTDWKNRTAIFTNLQHGDYTFKVKASNRDGVWNNHETILHIKVLPPPWKTWWAYSLYGFTFAAILFAARRSIIQRERLASKLKMERVELEKTLEVDRLRSTFFTNITHEFRTPLTLIQGPAQNLIEKLKKEKQIKANEAIPQLDLVLQNSNRLLRLVNQVLDLSKLESGGIKKELAEDELLSFMKTVVEHFALLAVQKNIFLVQEFPRQLIKARFDKDKLEKILSNLIFNALKFTPEKGRIVVAARLSTESHQNGFQQMIMQVKDNGKGISPNEIDKIFERFYQVSEGDNQNAGAGIGLALSKELAEFLGGSLSVESDFGAGSTFTLKLPLEVLEIKEDIISNPVTTSESASLKKIEEGGKETQPLEEKPLLLIVEDHVELRKFIISCLGDNYQYLEASNGKEGLEKTIEELPTLILSDVMMPIMDGVEMCNKIKQDHRINHIPVILLTAKASDDSKLAGLEKGADDYLIKPFNKEELTLRIRNQVLAQKRMQEKIRIELLSGSTIVKAVSADEKFIEQVKHIIESRMADEKLGVETLAEDIGLSRVQLYRKVNALTGISVNDFIRKLRLQKAAQLLSQNWGPIAQVAYEVGFSNPSYFSKCFKEEFGVLPSNFVKENT